MHWIAERYTEWAVITLFVEKKIANWNTKSIWAIINRSDTRTKIILIFRVSTQKVPSIKNNRRKYEKERQNFFDKKFNEKCACCSESHPIMCTKFKSLSVNERRDIVKQKSLCLLCLKNTPKHWTNWMSIQKDVPPL